MGQYTNFDIPMPEDDAFRFVAMAIKDNPAAEKVLEMIHRDYYLLMKEYDALYAEIEELKGCK